MGNRPSAPPPTPPTPPTPPPPTPPPPPPTPPTPPPPAPVIPVCDAECQKQKKLNALKSAMNNAAATKNTNPEAYSKARIAYYTELNGPGWLEEERKRIADEKVSPNVMQITQEYKALKESINNQDQLMRLIDVINTQKGQTEDEMKYVTDQTEKNRTEAGVLNRLGLLTRENFTIEPNVFERILQVIIAVLAVFIIQAVYTRITNSSMLGGGKSLPLHLTR